MSPPSISMGARMQKEGLGLPWRVSHALQPSSIEVNQHTPLLLRALSSHCPTTCTEGNNFPCARLKISLYERAKVFSQGCMAHRISSSAITDAILPLGLRAWTAAVYVHNRPLADISSLGPLAIRMWSSPSVVGYPNWPSAYPLIVLPY